MRVVIVFCFAANSENLLTEAPQCRHEWWKQGHHQGKTYQQWMNLCAEEMLYSHLDEKPACGLTKKRVDVEEN